MSRNRLLLLLVSALIGPALISGSAIARAQDAVPYIYFYSREDQAFIIERADGTDRRTLVSYDLKEDYPYDQSISGAGWSPSGRWFSWSQVPSPEGGLIFADDVYFFDNTDAANVQHVHFDIESMEIDWVQWSPVDDLLLIVSGSSVGHYLLQIYDPTTRTYRLRWQGPPEYSTYHPQWSADGSSIVLQGTDNVLHIIPLRTSHIFDTPAAFDYNSDEVHCEVIHPFTNGEVAFRPALDELAVIDSRTFRITDSVQLPDPIRQVLWSPDNQYALIGTDRSEAWLYHRTTSKVIDLGIVGYGAACVNVLWAPDSRHLVIRTDHNDVNIFETSGQKIQTVQQCDIGLGLPDYGWATNTRLVINVHCPANSETSLTYIYDIGGELRIAMKGIAPFIVKGNLAITTTSIVDLNTSEIKPLEALLPVYSGIYRLVWDTTGQWFFMRQYEDYRVWLAKSDATFSAEIAQCPLDSSACYGWLPPQVKLN